MPEVGACGERGLVNEPELARTGTGMCAGWNSLLLKSEKKRKPEKMSSTPVSTPGRKVVDPCLLVKEDRLEGSGRAGSGADQTAEQIRQAAEQIRQARRPAIVACALDDARVPGPAAPRVRLCLGAGEPRFSAATLVRRCASSTWPAGLGEPLLAYPRASEARNPQRREAGFCFWEAGVGTLFVASSKPHGPGCASLHASCSALRRARVGSAGWWWRTCERGTNPQACAGGYC